MYPFGFVNLLALITICVRNRNFNKIYIQLLIYTICIDSFINIGYWFKLGAYEMQYSEGLIGILGIMSFLVLFKKPFDKRLFIYGNCMIFIAIISLVYLIINPLEYGIVSYGMSWREYFYNNTIYPVFSLQSIKMLIRMVLFILISIASFTMVKKDELQSAVYSYIKLGMVVTCFTIFEFVIKNLLRSNIINLFISWFFGIGESTLTKLLERDNIFSLQGFTREPSHLAITLFWLGLMIIFSVKNNKNIKYFLPVIYMCLFLSRSFAAILYILSLITIYAIANNKQTKFLLLAMLISPLIFMSDYFIYYTNRIQNVLALTNFSSADITISEHVRMVSIIENIRILIKRPLLGIGLGTSYAHGAIPSLLSNMGVLGFASWFLFVFGGLSRLRINGKTIIIIFIFLLNWFFTGDLGIIYAMPLLLFAIVLKFDCGSVISNGRGFDESIINNN